MFQILFAVLIAVSPAQVVADIPVSEIQQELGGVTQHEAHADHEHEVLADKQVPEGTVAYRYPVVWTHYCGFTATYYVWPGRVNWFICGGCWGRFYIHG